MSARVDIIRAWATRLADLQPRTAHPDDASLLGIMAGALYSLEKADQLGYQDARGTAPNLDVLANEFRTTLRKIGKGDQPPQTWHGRVGRWRGGVLCAAARPVRGARRPAHTTSAAGFTRGSRAPGGRAPSARGASRVSEISQIAKATMVAN